MWPIAIEAVVSGFMWAGHGIAAMDLSIGLAPRAARPFYLAAFVTTGGVAFGVASILAGQAAAVSPAQFVSAGQWGTNLHILFAIPALGRLGAGVLALRLHDPGARGGGPNCCARSLSRCALPSYRTSSGFPPSPDAASAPSSSEAPAQR